MKQTSAGLIITDGDKLLLGHVTGQAHWDIPKGGIDKSDNSPEEACVREVFEETGLNIHTNSIKRIGFFKYIPKKKDLELFYLFVDPLPNIEDYFCQSTFIAKNGKEKPEIDGYKYVSWEVLEHYVRPNLLRVLTSTEVKQFKENEYGICTNERKDFVETR